ncbi:hypothetical protein LJR230_001334 [Trinickia sp. LjRoot230]|uniref:hypothetical protein n=1 Tax=Trinickia sp. LjRoot230 TaxID=3342288 RepID=UPI003ECD94B1
MALLLQRSRCAEAICSERMAADLAALDARVGHARSASFERHRSQSTHDYDRALRLRFLESLELVEQPLLDWGELPDFELIERDNEELQRALLDVERDAQQFFASIRRSAAGVTGERDD